MKYKNGLCFGFNPVAFSSTERNKFFVLQDIISFWVYLAFLFLSAV